jgi:hypothetical protein
MRNSMKNTWNVQEDATDKKRGIQWMPLFALSGK